MSKLWKGLKSRYLSGIDWMRDDEGLASMMYLATTITIVLEFFIWAPENAMRYAVTGIVNVIAVYLYSFVMLRIHLYGELRMVQFLGAVAIEFLIGGIVGSGLNFWLLSILFVVPIIVAGCMILMQENCMSLSNFFAGRRISGFAIVIISALLPAIFIAFPLFFLEWSIFTKVAIVLGYVLIAPIICWADAEDYGIFGALGFEW